MSTRNRFHRPEEQAAYALLHHEGWSAFSEQYGGQAQELVNRWQGARLAQIKDDGKEIVHVKTYEKYLPGS